MSPGVKTKLSQIIFHHVLGIDAQINQYRLSGYERVLLRFITFSSPKIMLCSGLTIIAFVINGSRSRKVINSFFIR